jgi:hypothetical protein
MNFIHVSTANDYVSFDWIGTNEKIQLKEWFIYQKNSDNFFGQIKSEISVEFSLPSLRFIVSIFWLNWIQCENLIRKVDY